MSAALLGAGSPELVHDDSDLSQIDHKITALPDGGWVVTWTTVDVDQLGSSEVYARVFGSDGEPKSEEFLVNEFTEGSQRDPDIVTLPDGTFAIFWTSYGQSAEFETALYYKQYDSSGTPLTEETFFEGSVDIAGDDKSIIVLDDGGILVSWKNFSDQVIYQGKLDADLLPVGEIERVSNLDAFGENYIDTHALDDGGWLAVWRSSGAEQGIFIRRFASDGSPVDEASLVNVFGAPVNDAVTSTVSHPHIAILADGSFVVVWQASGADGVFDYDSDIYMQRFGADGVPIGDTSRVNNVEPFQQDDAQVLALPDGGWLVVWTDEAVDSGGGITTRTEPKIVAQRYDADGNMIGDNLVISSSPDISQQYPELVLLSNGTILVSWWAFDFASIDPPSRSDIVQQVFTLPTIAFSADYDENQNTGDVLVTVTNIADVLGYEITGGDPGGVVPWFAINAAGEITLTEAGLASTANDYEEGDNGFVLTVQAMDGVGSVGDATNVSLQVNDVNDVAPSVFLGSRAGAIREDFDSTERVKMADIVIVDDSVGTNVFSLSGDDADLFEIIGSILYLKAGAELDYESGNTTLDVTVEVNDASLGGDPDSSVDLSVEVIDVDNEPEIIEPSGPFSYDENRNGTDVLATVTVTGDIAATGFQIISGDPGGEIPWFEINAAGEITFTDAGVASVANDFETPDNSFILSVAGSNVAGNLGAPISVSITVGDVDEQAPVIAPITLSTTYDENRSAMDVLATVTATDNVAVTGYQITNGDPGGTRPWFEINAAGEITLTDAGVATAANNHETGENSFNLSVTASDAAGNVSAPIAVTLTTEDVGTSTPLSADDLDEDNIVFGSVHEDHIDAGAGSDVLFGGLGTDVFIFDTGYGFDIITDFSSGEDIIDLSRAGVMGDDDLTILDYENGKGALITYSEEGDQVLLLGVDYTSVTTDDFLFV